MTTTLKNWANPLLAAVIASFVSLPTYAASDDLCSVVGIKEAAGAYLELRAYVPARLIIFHPIDGSVQAFVLFPVGGYTFGYSPTTGSRFCSDSTRVSDLVLAKAWSHGSVGWVEEKTRAEILAAGFQSDGGDYANGCLVDSLLHYYRLSDQTPKANWKGIFIVAKGADQLGSGHAVLVYLIGAVAWVYDPEGREARYLGPIDLQAPQSLTRLLDPQAGAGGWLQTEDIAWIRRHRSNVADKESQ